MSREQGQVERVDEETERSSEAFGWFNQAGETDQAHNPESLGWSRVSVCRIRFLYQGLAGGWFRQAGAIEV